MSVDHLKTYLHSFDILSDEEVVFLAEKSRHKSLKKEEYAFREGEVCKHVAFVDKGMFRTFYHTSSLEETTYCFNFSSTFISAYSSFITQTPTIENIQALTDAELYLIAREHILELEAKSSNLTKLLKLIAEQEYIKMEKRIFLLQKESAEKRYEDLLNNQSELLELIPLNYISSYLGITPRHLSRIRKSMLK